MTTYEAPPDDECLFCGGPEGSDELAQHEHMTECHGDVLAERRGEPAWLEQVD
jgi:hypothetical protein